MRLMETESSGLTVAFVPGVTPDKWARVWRDRHPDLPLRLVPVEEGRERDVLETGDADLCLARLPVDRSTLLRDDLHCVVLYEEVPVVVAGTEHLVAAAEEVSLEDLREEVLLLPHPTGWRPTAPQPELPPMTAQEAVATAAAGTGVVILPMSVARLHHRKDVVRRPVTDLPTAPVGLIWLRDADSPVHQDFVGVVRGRRAGSSRGLHSDR